MYIVKHLEEEDNKNQQLGNNEFTLQGNNCLWKHRQTLYRFDTGSFFLSL